MSEEDTLERIMEDFEFDIEEGDPNAQSNRLEALHREGKITDEEFEVLRTELLTDTESPSDSTTTPDERDKEPTDWLPEETLEEIITIYRDGIEGSGPYSDAPSYHSILFQIAALPSGAEVSIACGGSGGVPTAVMAFSERDHEERFREYVEQNAPYEVAVDLSDDSQAPQMGVKFNVIPGGYDGDISREDAMLEINQLLRMVAYTYGMSMSDLTAGTITVDAR